MGYSETREPDLRKETRPSTHDITVTLLSKCTECTEMARTLVKEVGEPDISGAGQTPNVQCQIDALMACNVKLSELENCLRLLGDMILPRTEGVC